MRLTLTQEFEPIPIAGGTLQNVSNNAAIEVNTSSDGEDEGLILPPLGTYRWGSAQLYVRAIGATHAEVAVLAVPEGSGSVVTQYSFTLW